jgi:hypothetical protein
MRQSFTTALLLGVMLFAGTAHAQYAWLDAKGVRQYSDQPPPVDTPASKILKTPRGMAVAATTPPADATAAAPTKAAPTLADREADYRKRHAAAEDAQKKAATASQNADARRANCAAAAKNKEQLDTGRRLRSAQNVVLTEADKARQQAENAKVLQDCKSAPAA